MAYKYEILYDKKNVIDASGMCFDTEDEAITNAQKRIDELSAETNKHYSFFDYAIKSA